MAEETKNIKPRGITLNSGDLTENTYIEPKWYDRYKAAGYESGMLFSAEQTPVAIYMKRVFEERCRLYSQYGPYDTIDDDAKRYVDECISAENKKSINGQNRGRT
jgi:hypothetical protein